MYAIATISLGLVLPSARVPVFCSHALAYGVWQIFRGLTGWTQDQESRADVKDIPHMFAEGREDISQEPPSFVESYCSAFPVVVTIATDYGSRSTVRGVRSCHGRPRVDDKSAVAVASPWILVRVSRRSRSRGVSER